MNKSQKIIITIYLILSPIVGFYSSYFLGVLDGRYSLNGYTVIIGSLITVPFFFIFFGIITFILYKLWADKK